MLDFVSTRGKIIDAALRLAASTAGAAEPRPDRARRPAIGLAEFRKEFSSKADILAAYTRMVDDAVLAKAEAADAGAVLARPAVRRADDPIRADGAQ